MHPPSCEMTLDVRCNPDISERDVLGILQNHVNEAVEGYRKGHSGPCEATVTISGINRGFNCTDSGAIRLANEFAGKQPETPGSVISYITEAGFFSEFGPTVVCGPGNLMGCKDKNIGSAHAPNEGIEKGQIVNEFAQMLDRVGTYCSKPNAMPIIPSATTIKTPVERFLSYERRGNVMGRALNAGNSQINSRINHYVAERAKERARTAAAIVPIPS